jgi:hypothetical protein
MSNLAISARTNSVVPDVRSWGSSSKNLRRLSRRFVSFSLSIVSLATANSSSVSLELQRINRAREVLRDKITAAGGAGYLTSDGIDLLGLGRSDDEVNWAVERVLTDGIATAGEIAKAKS